MKNNHIKSGIRTTVHKVLLSAVVVCGLSAGAACGAEKPEIFVQLGHQAGVTAAAFSGDGRFLATGSDDNVVKLWDVASGAEIRTFAGQGARTGAVAVSARGEQIASGDEKGIIKVWDTATGKVLTTMATTGRHRDITFLAFSPDGHTVASVDMDGGTLNVWEVATGRVLRTVSKVRGYSRLAAGETHLVAETGHDKYDVVESTSGKAVAVFETNRIDLFAAVSLSRDGRYGLFLKNDYNAKRLVFEMVDIREGKIVSSWNVNEKPEFRRIALSPDGKKAIAVGPAGARLWDAMTGKELTTITTSHTDGAAFSPDGRSVIFTGRYVPTLWDIADGRWGQAFARRPLTVIYSASLGPDGDKAVVNTEKSPLVWDIKNGKPLKVLEGYTSVLRFTADGKYLQLISEDKTRELWDVAAGKTIYKASVAHFSRDGRYATERVDDRTLRVKEIATGREIMTYTEPAGKIVSFMLAENNRHLLSVAEKTATRIDTATGRKDTFRWTEPYRHSVALSPDGKSVAVAVQGETLEHYTLRLYNFDAGKEVLAVKCYAAVVGLAFAFSPDGGRILFPGDNKTIVLADTATGAVIKRFVGQRDIVYDLEFSVRGDRFVSTGAEEAFRLWDTDDGRIVTTFAGHENWVRTASLSRDGKRVLSASSDNTIRSWDAATGRERAKFLSFTDGEWVVITPEGYFNASANGAKYLNVRVGNRVYGVDQFYSKFYRPELVQLALAGRNIPKGETLGDILASKPAPSVRIASPAPGISVSGSSVTVTVRVADNGGGIGNVMIHINGAQVANETRAVAVKGKTAPGEQAFSFTVPLLEGRNDIRAIAFNRDNSMESVPAEVSVNSRAAMDKPNLHALVIGINEYKNKSISLNYAVSDARAFAEALKKTASPLFAGVDVRVLATPAETTREAIGKAFAGMRAKVKPNDLFVFYDASHGVVDVVDNEEQYFLLTSNVFLLSSRHLGRDAISQKELAGLIGGIPAQKKVVVLDTCNAGKGGKEIQVALLQQTRGLTDATAVKLLQRAIGSAVFSASSDTQLALEGYKGHGLFTYVLIEGLKGKADIKNDGYITVLGLADYVEGEVLRLSEEVFKRQQTPTIQTGANFPIGKTR